MVFQKSSSMDDTRQLTTVLEKNDVDYPGAKWN